MELRHIRYFIRAAELAHFTQAAESLYISQPTLSNHIQQLEEEIGLPLFDRLGRKVQLTEAGLVFLEHARQAIRELEWAQEEIGDLKGIVSGAVRIGALPGVGRNFLPSLLAAFHISYPQIGFELKTGNSDFMEEEILSSNIEVGLSFVPPARDGIDSQLLLRENRSLVVSDKHLLASRIEVQLKELSTLSLALLNRQFRSRTSMDSVFLENNIDVDVLVEMDDLEALLRLVSIGDIGTILTPFGVGDYPGVRLIPIADVPPVEFGVIWKERAHLSPIAKAFIAFMVDEHSTFIQQTHGALSKGH